MRLTYALGRCSLGRVLVAATPRGICAIALGARADRLLGGVRRRFPTASIAAGDAALRRRARAVARSIDAPTTLDLPLDVRGTPFQRRVWRALRALPVGSTVTYATLAARVGHPRAVRAVARACAANPIAVAIPCHRVLGATGALTGYRWGLERKRRLLARERRASPRRRAR